MPTYKKNFWKRSLLLLAILFLLIAGGISAVSITHRPHTLWTMLASLYIKPPSAAAISGGFTTLPPGATLPSEQNCTSRIHRFSWEPRTDNNKANQSVPTKEQIALLTPWDKTIGVDPQANTLLQQITGNFTGTTNEIFQWAACKWGMDENIVRAVAIVETNWNQNKQSDYATNQSYCPSGTWDGKGCYQSYGLLQLKYRYFGGTWSMSRDDTAFNVEYALGVIRTCFEGWTTYLNNRTPLAGYPHYQAGDLWGCVGRWYSGSWYNQGSITYIQKVKTALANQDWLQPGF
ncbi:MAG: hypothetical protein ABI234_12435 [Ktedonobacteraceae bacterium]